MATFTGTKALATVPAHEGLTGVVGVAFGSVDITAAPVLADVYRFCKLPAGSVILGGMLYGGVIDSNGVMAVNLGTETAPTMLGAALLMEPTIVPAYKKEQGILLPFQGALQVTAPTTSLAGPQLVAAEQFVQAVVTAVPTGFLAGRLSVVVYYTKNLTQLTSL